MGELRSDSAVCRRIVAAFLDFLKSIEPAPGVDLEGLDVARDCLEEVFKLNQSIGDLLQPGLLINMFSSLSTDEQYKPALCSGVLEVPNSSSTVSGSQQNKDCDALPSNNGNQTIPQHMSGQELRDELFVKFYAALDKTNFFSTSPGETEDPLMVAKATRVFHDALNENQNSKGDMNIDNLAETFKTKGNLSMKLKLYSDAVELYTIALALCEKNAVYYCNRAAAYTQMEKYSDAIEDCLKSIEIDPNYSKAYSRLGLAYYNCGNYAEALGEGFLRALQLDPNNDSIKENIRATQQKLIQSSTFGNEMADAGGQGSTTVNSNEADAINVNMNFSQQAPEHVRDALRFFVNSLSSSSSSPSS